MLKCFSFTCCLLLLLFLHRMQAKICDRCHNSLRSLWPLLLVFLLKIWHLLFILCLKKFLLSSRHPAFHPSFAVAGFLPGQSVCSRCYQLFAVSMLVPVCKSRSLCQVWMVLFWGQCCRNC